MSAGAPRSAAVAREDVADAARRLRGMVHATPLVPSDDLASRRGARVLMKLENLQRTGSFKVRGAANRLLTLTEAERRRGVITCSSGNHGRAVAFVSQRLGIPATICVPAWVDPVKAAAIERHGAAIVREGASFDEAEAHALRLRDARDLVYVSAFDDPHVIAGQGTVGLEIVRAAADVATVVVPLSGGGLVAGVAVAVKGARPDATIVAVSAERAAVMYHSLRAGRPTVFPEEPTVASALAGGIGPDNRYSFELVRDLVDEHVLVPEEEIVASMRWAITEHKVVVEGGGAVGLAALRSGAIRAPGTVAVVVSGGNIDTARLVEVLSS